MAGPQFRALGAIRARLIVMVVGTVMPLFALLLADTLSDREAALQTAVKRVEDYARLTALRQSQIFADADALLSTLQVLPEVDVEGGPACGELMSTIVSRRRPFRTMGVVRPDGMLVCHNLIRRAQTFGDAELLNATLAAKPDDFVVGRMVVGRITGKPTIITARQLVRDGETKGVVFVSIDLAGFSALAGRFDESVGASLMVLDAMQGMVVDASAGLQEFIGRSLGSHALMEAIRAAPYGGTVSRLNIDGVDDIAAFAPLHDSALSKLVTVAIADRALALAEVDQAALKRFVLALAAAALAIAVVSGLGYWTLVLPIGRLTEAVRRIGGGDTSARTAMEPWQPREMQTLSETLNVTAERLEASARQLAALANEDGLTRLANRRRFDEALAAECARLLRSDEELSLLLIDVDHFKRFNDAYGHQAGDDCLKRISERLMACASRPGDIAARYGGEEFAVILPNTDEDGAAAVAGRILRAVSELRMPHRDAPKGHVTVSVGSVSASKDRRMPTSSESLVRLADEALYDAKAAGRGVHVASGRRALSLVAGRDFDEG